MAKQLVDTTTNNGTHIGDPAKTAFEKVNANFNELYPAALPESEVEKAAARGRFGLKKAALADILGAVSQLAGVPTGAIIERGSNANGDYIRWADGTQICHYRGSIAPGVTVQNLNTSGGYRSAQVAHIFPAGFAATPVVLGDISNSASGVRIAFSANVNSPSSCYFVLTSLGSFTTTETHLYGYVAIGRWF